MREINHDGLKLKFTPFVFISHTEPNGLLPLDSRAQAAWYYCRIAHGHLKAVDEGAAYEGEVDNQESLKNLVLAVAAMYRIKDPSELVQMIPLCKREAQRELMEWDSRIEHPAAGTFVGRGN